MAKSGLFISREEVEKVIKNFCEVESIDEINGNSHQTRYKLSKDSKQFSIDIYYRNDKTCTINLLGNADKKILGEQLKELINSQVVYGERASASFTIKIKEKEFENLIHYLGEIDTVTKDSDEDKGDNGRIVKLTTDFGDRTTLTYYNSSGTMRYQGLMMDLYVEVKTFVTPLGNELSNIVVSKNSDILDLSSKIDDFISLNVPNYYANADKVIQEFIEDSIKMLLSNGELNDYAVWATPVLRVLEQRIKEILGFNGIIIDDKKGFKVGRTYIFDSSQIGATRINVSVDSQHSSCLISCYEYWKDNRHQLFHGNQVAATIRRVPCPSDAQVIIVEVCKRLENSYAIIGK
ncbi:type II toxin-antitoxin system RnlA family toxin [Enterococcus ureasiticus]|uniref:type II toxin-antitoxin system RnlA family toxin n=1 Tax=Enterococcus ureasiticus TaxID=903984 RepID=UPI001A8F21F6|nr:type II toxin-antitoxin system RnlA family toxin [Enterococcus ureasiticus]MBO0474418.1 type II toxin-antitoxin system RnlA family toxin [Enterococcus ureasiticus]